MKFEKIKADTPEAHPHVIPAVGNHQKETSEWEEPVHKIIIPYQVLGDSTTSQLSKMHPKCFKWKRMKI